MASSTRRNANEKVFIQRDVVACWIISCNTFNNELETPFTWSCSKSRTYLLVEQKKYTVRERAPVQQIGENIPKRQRRLSSHEIPKCLTSPECHVVTAATMKEESWALRWSD